MKYTLFFICIAASLMADPLNPITEDLQEIASAPFPYEHPESSLNTLIATTEHQLKRLEVLKNHLFQYKETHQRYLVDTGNRRLSEQLVNLAYDIQGAIDDLYLTHLFEDEFLQEIHFFSNIARKWKTNPRTD